jgi:hypothetical protein
MEDLRRTAQAMLQQGLPQQGLPASEPRVLVPETADILLPWFYPSAESEAEQQRILASRFYLVKIAGNGDVWRCRRCHGKHDFLTLMCVPQPWSGLSRGLFAYWKTVGAHDAARHMPPSERSRLRELDRLFGPAAGLPDFASAHPETARGVGTSQYDADLGAYTFVASEPSATALGLVVPITAEEARKYGRRINMRGIKPPFSLEGVDLS